MENFFASKSWPHNDGRLHLYVLPPDEFAERFAEAQELIGGVEHLPLMPRAYLHCTLQGLGRHDDEVSQAELTAFGSALTDALAGVAAFELSFPGPQVREAAVECPAEPSTQWDGLVAAVREAVTAVWGDSLPDPPHGPHLTLAYATGPANTDDVVRHLTGVGSFGRMPVQQVHLCSVTMRPEVGIFDFTELATWDLARQAAPSDG